MYIFTIFQTLFTTEAIDKMGYQSVATETATALTPLSILSGYLLFLYLLYIFSLVDIIVHENP